MAGIVTSPDMIYRNIVSTVFPIITLFDNVMGWKTSSGQYFLYVSILLILDKEIKFSPRPMSGLMQHEGETLLCQSRHKNATLRCSRPGSPDCFEILTSYSLRDGSARDLTRLSLARNLGFSSLIGRGDFAIFGCWQFVAVIVTRGRRWD